MRPLNKLCILLVPGLGMSNLALAQTSCQQQCSQTWDPVINGLNLAKSYCDTNAGWNFQNCYDNAYRNLAECGTAALICDLIFEAAIIGCDMVLQSDLAGCVATYAPDIRDAEHD